MLWDLLIWIDGAENWHFGAPQNFLIMTTMYQTDYTMKHESQRSLIQMVKIQNQMMLHSQNRSKSMFSLPQENVQNKHSRIYCLYFFQDEQKAMGLIWRHASSIAVLRSGLNMCIHFFIYTLYGRNLHLERSGTGRQLQTMQDRLLYKSLIIPDFLKSGCTTL